MLNALQVTILCSLGVVLSINLSVLGAEWFAGDYVVLFTGYFVY